MSERKIESYEDLILAAMAQPEPQRLLFVFAKAELPRGYTAEQQQRFEDGDGGVLTPVVCVDKLPGEVMHFNDLVEESKNTGIEWDVAFVGAMAGRDGFPPMAEDAEMHLTTMMNKINSGIIAEYLTFNKEGELISLSQ